MTVEVVPRDGGSVLAIRVQPGASRASVVGEQDGAVKVRVCSPPVEGRANDDLCSVLATALGLRQRQVAVLSGHTARNKKVWVDLVPEALVERLAGLVGPTH